MSARLYRLLLLLYPRAFRDRYAAEMEEDFRQLRRDGAVTAWRRVLRDLAADAPARRVARALGLGRELVADLRHATLLIRADLRFAAITVGLLALALAGAATAFALARSTLWMPVRDLPQPERLVAVFSDRDGRLGNLSYPDFEDVERSQLFTAAAAAVPVAAQLGVDDALSVGSAALVSDDFFATLGVLPATGRVWQPSERDRRLAVVGAELAAASGGLEVGGTLQINGSDYTVIGVMPAGFRGPWIHVRPQAWVPSARIGDLMGFMGSAVDGSGERILSYRGYMTFQLFGRLADGGTVEAARERLRGVAAGIREANPGYGLELTARPARESAFDPRLRGEIRQAALLIGMSAALVLLVVLGNLGNLARVRALGRSREMAVRSALGAHEGRLRGLVAWESLLLTAGAMTGALAFLPSILGAAASVGLPGGLQPDVRLDAPTAGVVVGLAALAAVVLGIAGRTGGQGSAALRGSATASASRSGLSPLPVIFQVALSLMLLSAAALLSRTVLELTRVDPGFDPSGVLLASFDPTLLGYDEERGRVMTRDLLEAVDSLPGVAAASLASDAPLAPAVGFHPLVLDDGERPPELRQSLIGPGYFDTIAVDLAAGRAFRPTDDESSPGVAIVNEAFVRAVWGEESALGRRIGHGPEGPWFDVVGVVRDYHHDGLRRPPLPHVYWPQQQVYDWAKGSPVRTLLVRGRDDRLVPMSDVLAAIRSVEPRLALGTVGTLADLAREGTVQERRAAALLTAASTLTLGLTALGIYALQAYRVRRRFREIGVRMAVGAERHTVQRMVLAQGLRVAAIGTLAGAAGAVLVARFFRGLLYAVPTFDPLSLLVASAAMLLLAAAGSYWPARHASRIDPVVALRTE